MKISKGILLIVLILVLAILLGWPFYQIYNYFYFSPLDGFFYVYDAFARYVIGSIFAYLFFLFLFFTAFGGSKKYWWIGIAGAPALLFLAYFDFSHLYFHLLFPIAGWLIGWGIGKLMVLTKKGV